MGPGRHILIRLRDDESGFGLIEVVVSAMLLVLVASGIYLGLDAASATSGTNKHRSIASALAQSDQDRMRAMAVNELSNYRESYTSRVGPVTYTIRSSASWVTDETGVEGCASETDPDYLPGDGTTSGSAANYLRIASEVTWPGIRIDPVTVESIVGPPAGSFRTDLGSLAVHVRDRNGDGVQGVTVSLAGAQSHVDVTNQQGCVLWGYLPVGNYDVTISRSGYVDPAAVSQPSKEVGVAGEATSTTVFDYDAGGRIQADYETLLGGEPAPANATVFTAVTSHLTVPLPPIGDGAPHGSYTSGLVYPFTDPYGVYAGDCAGADPVTYGQPAQLALVEPGATTAVPMRLPPVDLRALHDGRPVSGATARFTATGSGCSAAYARTTGSDGYLTDRALPYGEYAVCVQATIIGTTYAASGTVDNTTPTGVPVDDARFELSAGSCP